MKTLTFDNRFIQQLPGDGDTSNISRQVHGACWSQVSPTPVEAPLLVAYAAEVADLLDLDETDIADPLFAQVFVGNCLLPGMQTYATCYGGHQFGNWAGQLGDGRAIGLGEVVNRRGQRWELQLKGAGPTPYARHADGRAVLRSSIREFLCSEAMHHLGIPTTRALCVVASGEMVSRDMFYDGNPRDEPGAVVCRVSPSFIRFGHFEIFAARREEAVLQRLIDFTVARDFPELAVIQPLAQRRAEWFRLICERTASLMVEWLRVGFVHGVMNTDNMSILGLTIDYGPYGWIDNFDPAWTPNTTDRDGRRYCFGRQPAIARWNLERLADVLTYAFASRGILDAGLACFDSVYETQLGAMLASKFGLTTWETADGEMIEEVFGLMQQAEVDMTDFFRRLAAIDTAAPQVESLRESFYREELYTRYHKDFAAWLARYSRRVNALGISAADRQQIMNAVNPRFILRNYLAQQAIDLAEQGDFSEVSKLLEIARTPYADLEAYRPWYAKRPDWARNKAGCSMLSCSS